MVRARIGLQRVWPFPGTVFENKQGHLRIDAAHPTFSGGGLHSVSPMILSPAILGKPIGTVRSHSATAFSQRPEDNLRNGCRKRGYIYHQRLEVGCFEMSSIEMGPEARRKGLVTSTQVLSAAHGLATLNRVSATRTRAGH